MKKSLLALAVAGAVAAPYAAHTQAAELTLGGWIQERLYINDTAEKGGAAIAETKSQGLHQQEDEFEFNVNAVEDVGFGTGFANWRIDGGNSGATPSTDSVKVGLTGNFGTVTLGEAGNYAVFGQLATGDLVGQDAEMKHIDQGDQSRALSYEAPAFVPGLQVGANLITDSYGAEGDTTYDGGVEDLKSGYALGAKYSHDFGDKGSLVAGFGTTSSTTTIRNKVITNTANGEAEIKDDGGESSYSYTSFGVVYSIIGIKVGVQQESLTGREETINTLAANGAKASAGTKTEYEDASAVGVMVGYTTGPFSGDLNSVSITGGEVAGSDNGEYTGTVLRINLNYTLSENVSFQLRNQGATGEYEKWDEPNSSAFTYLGMKVTF